MAPQTQYSPFGQGGGLGSMPPWQMPFNSMPQNPFYVPNPNAPNIPSVLPRTEQWTPGPQINPENIVGPGGTIPVSFPEETEKKTGWGGF